MKIVVRFSVVLLFSLLLISCISQTKKSMSIDGIQTLLESDKQINREEPFVERKFIPYSDDNPLDRAVSYGCYRAGQAPWGEGPSEEQILEDLDIISKHWNMIRVYNADDDTELIIKTIEKHNFPIKVMLGVWLENETDKPEKRKQNITNTTNCIELIRKYPETILAVNVGNETQVYWSWHKMNEDNLIRYIRIIRENTSIPITTADDYNYWNKPESKQVSAEIDFITTHIHPLWNGKTLTEAISWTNEVINTLKQNHTEDQIVLGEIGWATNYDKDKTGDGQQGTLIKGKVDIKAQEEFLFQLEEWIEEKSITTFLFEAFDEPWKGGGDNSGANEIEKNWGVFYENRTPKDSFNNLIEDKIKKKNPKGGIRK